MFGWFRKMFFIKNKVASAVAAVGEPSPPYTSNANDIPRFESNTLHGLFESGMAMDKIFAVLDKLTPSQRKRACKKQYGRNKNFLEAVIDSNHPQRTQFIAGLVARLGDDAADVFKSRFLKMIWPKENISGSSFVGTDFSWNTEDLRTIIINMTPAARLKLGQSYYKDIPVGCTKNIFLEAIRLGRTDLLNLLVDEIGVDNVREIFMKMNGHDSPLCRVLYSDHSTQTKQEILQTFFNILRTHDAKKRVCAHRVSHIYSGRFDLMRADLNLMQVALIRNDVGVFDQLINAIGYEEAADLLFQTEDTFENHLIQYENLKIRPIRIQVHPTSLNENIRDRLYYLYISHTLRKKQIYRQPVSDLRTLLESIPSERRADICSRRDLRGNSIFNYALQYGNDSHVTEILKTYGYERAKAVFMNISTLTDVIKYHPDTLPIILDYMTPDELGNLLRKDSYHGDFLKVILNYNNKATFKQLMSKLKIEDIYWLSHLYYATQVVYHDNNFREAFHEIQWSRARRHEFKSPANDLEIYRIDNDAGVWGEDFNIIFKYFLDDQTKCDINRFKIDFMNLSRESQLRFCQAYSTPYHYTIVHLASLSNDVQFFEHVIDLMGGFEAFINTRSLPGLTPLHTALCIGNSLGVEKILSLISPEQLLEINRMNVFIRDAWRNLEYCANYSGKQGVFHLYQNAINNAQAAVDQKAAGTAKSEIASNSDSEYKHLNSTRDDSDGLISSYDLSEYSDDAEALAAGELFSEVATLRHHNETLISDNLRLQNENAALSERLQYIAQQSQYHFNTHDIQQLKNDNVRLSAEIAQLKVESAKRSPVLSSGLDTLNLAQYSEHTALANENGELTNQLTAQQKENSRLVAEVAQLHARLLALESSRTAGLESTSTVSASPVEPTSPAVLMAEQGLFSRDVSPTFERIGSDNKDKTNKDSHQLS